MKNVSFSDVLVVPQFKGMKELELLPVSMDEKVLPLLYQFGIDTNQGYRVLYQRHRNLQNKVVEGFLYSGEIRQDDEYRKSPFCDIQDRLVLASLKDGELMRDMSRSLSTTADYGNFAEASGQDLDLKGSATDSIFDKGYKEKESEFGVMATFVTAVRGSEYNASGALKNHKEYVEGQPTKAGTYSVSD